MGRVEVLEATRTAPNSRGRGKREALNVERIRVAAYCRVSTDDDDQLGSFESQKLYYEQKIRANRDWVNAGIFADEAITGTKVDKREGFQAMIQKCQNGIYFPICKKYAGYTSICKNAPRTQHRYLF